MRAKTNAGLGKYHNLLVSLFFLAFLALGLGIVDDYGISWDEAIQRRHGRVSIDYAAKKLGIEHAPLEPDWDLDDYQWSNYGMIYQIGASLIERALGYEDSPFAFYRLRHIINFLLFWLALLCFYRTLRLRWPDKEWYPLVGTLVLILSPRIFGHSFFNPKDHILLVFYLINTYTLLRFLKHRTWGALLIHVFATALALNTRLPALLVLLTTVLLLLWEQLFTKPGNYRRLAWIAAYVPLSFLLMIPFFPFLWQDTLHRLIGAFTEMSDFEWDSYNWLFGDRLWALDVPAYYIPAWILITTPIIYLVFIFTGLYRSILSSFSGILKGRLWRDYATQMDFIQLGLSVGPILVVIIMHSTLYNGWRHLHFAYPGLVFLLMVGFDRAMIWRPWARYVLAGGMVMTAINMVRYHPHEYVYFNYAIHGEYLIERFDMDYWGTGFREAFLELADQIPEGETRSVKCQVWPCKDNLLALPADARKKIILEDAWHKADYVATNFQWSEEKAEAADRKNHFKYPVVEIKPVGDLSIGIYEINKE